MKIAVIGTGYVGLVSGTCFSEFGFDVTCVDKDTAKIEALRKGIIPIYEPGLDELVKSNQEKGYLHFSTDTTAAVSEADIVFLAVGTPPRPEDGQANLSYVFEAAKEVAEAMQNYTLLVTKSTVPIGTGAKIEGTLQENTQEGARFDVASNPEFLREGSAIADFMAPDRVVIGTESAEAKALLEKLYAPLTRQHVPLLAVERETAEMIKYASNSFLAMKVAFINEMADICEKVGANVEAVAHGMGLDSRIGEKFLQAGPGFGGSCFPKDIHALMNIAQEHKLNTHLIDAILYANQSRKLAMAEKIEQAVLKSSTSDAPNDAQTLAGKTIAVLGLTFKPGTDDMRAAPSLEIVPALLQKGVAIRTFDPEGMEEAQTLLQDPNIYWAQDTYDALQDADALVILTEWNEFKALDLKRIKTQLTAPLIIDLRNIYPREQMKDAGFRYVSIGRAEA